MGPGSALFRRFSAKTVHFGSFLGGGGGGMGGGGCQNLPRNPFVPGDPPEILAKVPLCSTELLRKSEKKTQKKTTETGHGSMPERNLYHHKKTVKPHVKWP